MDSSIAKEFLVNLLTLTKEVFLPLDPTTKIITWVVLQARNEVINKVDDLHNELKPLNIF